MAYGIPPLNEVTSTESFTFRRWIGQIYSWIQSKVGLVTVTTNYTVPANIFYVRVDATAGPVTITLPPALNIQSRQIIVIKVDSSSNGVVVGTMGSDTIEGAATYSLPLQWTKAGFISNGNTTWELMDTNVFKTILASVGLILPKAAGNGIRVDLNNPTFPWADILNFPIPRTTGADKPTLEVYNGGVISEWSFKLDDVLDLSFHIPHDYLPGSDLFIHVHWSHNGTSISGTAEFTIRVIYAKGHNQANFPGETITVITVATPDIATVPQYRHRLDEVQLSSSTPSASLLDTADIEPDGIIIGRVRVSQLPTIGGGGKLFIHFVDLHYQSTGVGTKQKSPDFYT